MGEFYCKAQKGDRCLTRGLAMSELLMNITILTNPTDDPQFVELVKRVISSQCIFLSRSRMKLIVDRLY